MLHLSEDRSGDCGGDNLECTCTIPRLRYCTGDNSLANCTRINIYCHLFTSRHNFPVMQGYIFIINN